MKSMPKVLFGIFLAGMLSGCGGGGGGSMFSSVGDFLASGFTATDSSSSDGLSGLAGTKLKCDVIADYYPFWWSITSGGPSLNYRNPVVQK